MNDRRDTGSDTAKDDADAKNSTVPPTIKTPSNEMGVDTLLITQSFSLLEPKIEPLITKFYSLLFQSSPEIKHLLKNFKIDELYKKSAAALQSVVKNLDDSDALNQILIDMGEKQQDCGVLNIHYKLASTSLIEAMAKLAGKEWNQGFEDAWHTALTSISKIMLSAYKKPEDRTMVANKEKDEVVATANEKAEGLTKFQAAVENATTPMILVDRDLVVTYANSASIKVWEKYLHLYSGYFPGFDPHGCVGLCIDQFHAKPEHQRALLEDLSRLPYKTIIDVGEDGLKFEMIATPLIDDEGNHIGSTLEWGDVTEEVRRTEAVARLQTAVDGALTPIMMIDRDFIVTYVNQASIDIWKKYLPLYQEAYPGFDPDNVVGQCIDQYHEHPERQRKMLDDPSNLPYKTDLHIGDLCFMINITAIVDDKGDYVGNTLEWADVTEQRLKEHEVARLQQAIDGSATNIMMCDENLNIVYVNPAVIAMFKQRISSLRQSFPSLDPDNLVGMNIDQFHKNPAHQRALLSDPSRLPFNATIKIMDVELEINASMVTGPGGEYMGNMVEWKDITQEQDAERQIRQLVEGASMGEFSSRIDTTSYDGFFKQLGDLLNNLMTTCESGLLDIASVIKQLAEGNLTGSIEKDYHGLFGQLKNDVNSTVDNLKSMVMQIHEGAYSISNSATEISQGNTDLSQRTENQASSLEQTASSMEEMTSAVKSSADNARQANQLAFGAREQAESGGKVVAEAVHAMSAINKSSKQIAEIIVVIDEIAFQTNLLALNAAVEAARAGEQGRGFAVVATEVRNLAQRSAKAAKEIKSLIKDSEEKVDDGSRLVNDSGETLEEIVTAVKKVSDIIAEIAAASQEQSAGIEQVNRAITQLDEVTQQNAALVEEAAAASEALDEQAKGLTDQVSSFDVGEETSSPQQPAQKAPRVPAPQRAPAPAPQRAPKTAAPQKPAKSFVATETEEADEWEEF